MNQNLISYYSGVQHRHRYKNKIHEVIESTKNSFQTKYGTSLIMCQMCEYIHVRDIRYTARMRITPRREEHLIFIPKNCVLFIQLYLYISVVYICLFSHLVCTDRLT